MSWAYTLVVARAARPCATLTALKVSVDDEEPPGPREADEIASILVFERGDGHRRILGGAHGSEVLLRLLFGEIAAMRGVSERTVQRDWAKARVLLHDALALEGGSDAAAG